jgi:allantoicase
MAQADPQHSVSVELRALTSLPDLASARLGGRALIANDEFFAGKESLLNPDPAIFIPGKFTEFGKWMDGWETRRRREPGHDWCIIKLGLPGIIRAVNIDTAHFKGNQPEAATIEALEVDGDPAPEGLAAPGLGWSLIVPRTLLNPSSEHVVAVDSPHRWTHLRLNIFPDGGVARLRIHGTVLPDWKRLISSGDAINLAAIENGGRVIACNDMHFGSRHSLIMPGRAANMGDGWETRRRRGLTGGEHDWTIIQLGRRGFIEKIEVDTNHFKGNYPESCMIEVCDAPQASELATNSQLVWTQILRRTKLGPSRQHYFENLAASVPCTHARLNIYPDGGISRLRLHGRPVV